MNNKKIDYAYAGLLHDIGKFYQRTTRSLLLNEREKECTPVHPQFRYHTHLHSGYTSKFFHDYLYLDNQLERSTSAHHKEDLDEFDTIIRDADHIASRVDRNDESFDYLDNYEKTKYRYITSRLSSIMSYVDFGKQLNDATFELDSIDLTDSPKIDYLSKELKESIEEYNELFKKFSAEIEKDSLLIGNPTPYKFHRLYSLLYKYTTLIPSSTYETNKQTVSLFDHLKLTSAIASCLAQSHSKQFYMVEFDVSGIQKFIYQITEGHDTKKNIAKSLRGRSAFVSLITNAVTYKILNEFELTQANIIFNTGGGSVILLPYVEDTKERVEILFKEVIRELYQRFQTNITLVYGIVDLNESELESFKTEKALSLKTQLENKKLNKYCSLLNETFCTKELDNKELCSICGNDYAYHNHICKTCEDIIKVSDFYTKHDSFTIYYSFNKDENCDIDLGFASLNFFEKLPEYFINRNDYYYIDAVNHFEAGNVKMIANLVPKEHDSILNFESITKSLDASYGDQKLGILKMDVDNLGAIFAFGLKQGRKEIVLQRSLSKYLTLSRFMELFFGYKLKQICLDVSQRLQTKYENIFYINYAGGDDLVILGPIYGIVQLSHQIYEEFKKYVQNPNITLSAGIYIQNPKKPIRFGIKMADEALERSKSYMEDGKIVKNSITIMESTIPFTQFKSYLDKIEEYRSYLNDNSNPLSRSGFYKIMSQLSDKSLEEYYSLIPIIQYSLYRQMSEEKHAQLRKKVSYDLTTLREQYELLKCVTFMKLVILFTREEK